MRVSESPWGSGVRAEKWVGSGVGLERGTWKHAGHRFKEAHSQGHKVRAQNPEREPFLDFVPCNASLAHSGACFRREGLWVLPSSDAIYGSPSCGHAVMQQGERLVGMWTEPRESPGCRSFLGSSVIAFFTLRHPLWKVPLAGWEMSHLMACIFTSMSIPG